MLARKNRPGKCGTLPMSERWRLIEERVLSQANDHGVLFRRCERLEVEGTRGKPTYHWSTRYPNRWASYDELGDPSTFAAKVKRCEADPRDW